MIYRELALPLALKRAAFCAWQFLVEPHDPALVQHSIPPDGTTNLVLSRTPAGDLHAKLVGPSLAAMDVPVAQGWSFAGLRLRPEATASVIGHIPAVGTFEPLELQGRFASLWSDLAAAMDGLASWQRTSSAIGGLAGADRAIAASVDLLVASGGTIAISDVARRLGLSERQFRRRFHAAAGLSPKQYAAVQRVRRALILSLAEPNWAEIAHEAGFADQPHLARDIKDRFGAAPARVGGYLGGIRHEFVALAPDRFVQDECADAA